jgi:hypothetical protein
MAIGRDPELVGTECRRPAEPAGAVVLARVPLIQRTKGPRLDLHFPVYTDRMDQQLWDVKGNCVGVKQEEARSGE